MIGKLFLEAAPQVGHLVDQPSIFQGLIHQQFEPDCVERFLDQVVGTQLHRLDGRFDRGDTRSSR